MIHAVFRAAHSIKGGAGTFGLNEIASFTHVMETLLDEMRDGRRAISKQAVNILLNSVDVLRELMDAARDDLPPEMSRANEVKTQLDSLLSHDDDIQTQNAEQSDAPVAEHSIIQNNGAQHSSAGHSAAEQQGWLIKFYPQEHMLRTGNDTVRMFKELASLGDMESTADFSGLPEFVHMDPELSYLSWEIILKNNAAQGAIEKATIEEIFEWVEDDYELSIEPLMTETTADISPLANKESAAAETIAETVSAAIESPSVTKTTAKIIAIGASTGGTEAIKEVLIRMPASAPAVVISQHIPAAFSGPFAKRMDSCSAMTVYEAKDGQQILPGHVYIAPGSRHLIIERRGSRYICRLNDGPLVNRHKPSVDVMFRSVSQNVGSNAIGAILTGMGDDGARGMKEMHEMGSATIAQDEKSSVVWGMPGEAVKHGGVDHILSLEHITEKLLALCRN